MISKPHGGKLVDKTIPDKKKQEILKNKKKFKTLKVDVEQIKDAKNIAWGVYSPLTGFLKKKDFESVVSSLRLSGGVVWPIPIVLDLGSKDYKNIKGKKDILLVDEQNTPIAVLSDIEIFDYDKDFFAKNVFGALDKNHPGVESIYGMGDHLVGGEIELLDDTREPFPELNFTPRQTRKLFKDNGWESVAAFQTRNVPHRGHEYLQKHALKTTDGIFIQPVIGEKKVEDFKDEYTLACYELLIDRYFPKNKVILGVLPFKMRYAGPREAILHALIRKNYGCTHFIVGRDHAGVGNYYPPFAAQEIFDQFKQNEIDMEILKFSEVVFCQKCVDHQFVNGCKHEPESKISFSGTKLRESIKNRQQPPDYVIRPAVYGLLSTSGNSLVDSMYKSTSGQAKKGFVLWLTGLSQAGKTTLADEIFKILKGRNLRVERLDGDIVRENLTADLGFSKEDRDENIRRVGFVAKLLSRGGVGVVASFISPYKKQRDEVRETVENFIEAFCNAPLGVCEQRDTKGLYQRARRGEIKNFTGISDPYEAPEKPEVELLTHMESVEESASKLINYLEEHGYV